MYNNNLADKKQLLESQRLADRALLYTRKNNYFSQDPADANLLTANALWYLFKNNIETSFELYHLDIEDKSSQFTFIVIGRHPMTLPNDISTWNKETVICWPREYLVMPAYDFPAHVEYEAFSVSMKKTKVKRSDKSDTTEFLISKMRNLLEKFHLQKSVLQNKIEYSPELEKLDTLAKKITYELEQLNIKKSLFSIQDLNAYNVIQPYIKKWKILKKAIFSNINDGKKNKDKNGSRELKQLFEIASEAKQYATLLIPLGATQLSGNKLTQEERLEINDIIETQRDRADHVDWHLERLDGYFARFDWHLAKVNADFSSLVGNIEQSSKSGLGNCMELALQALYFILINYPEIDVELCRLENGDHAFLTIAAKIICDPWSYRIYPIELYEVYLKSYNRHYIYETKFWINKLDKFRVNHHKIVLKNDWCSKYFKNFDTTDLVALYFDKIEKKRSYIALLKSQINEAGLLEKANSILVVTLNTYEEVKKIKDVSFRKQFNALQVYDKLENALFLLHKMTGEMQALHDLQPEEYSESDDEDSESYSESISDCDSIVYDSDPEFDLDACPHSQLKEEENIIAESKNGEIFNSILPRNGNTIKYNCLLINSFFQEDKKKLLFNKMDEKTVYNSTNLSTSLRLKSPNEF
ncbi:MAG: hypothetical protein HKM04_08550 [Legionellales bacterium]|nr:hypothetical protein [Legionellales bacterium]